MYLDLHIHSRERAHHPCAIIYPVVVALGVFLTPLEEARQLQLGYALLFSTTRIYKVHRYRLFSSILPLCAWA